MLGSGRWLGKKAVGWRLEAGGWRLEAGSSQTAVRRALATDPLRMPSPGPALAPVGTAARSIPSRSRAEGVGPLVAETTTPGCALKRVRTAPQTPVSSLRPTA